MLGSFDGERQMLFDQLDQLRRGGVLILSRGFPPRIRFRHRAAV